MDRQDFMGLYESYMGVYEQDEYIEEDVEEIDEAKGEGPESATPGTRLFQQLFRGTKKIRGSKLTRQDTASFQGKGSKANRRAVNSSYDYDLYDLVLEYLLDEGLCESVENAEIMMAHMSEGWVDSIIDEAAKTVMSVTSPTGKQRRLNTTRATGPARNLTYGDRTDAFRELGAQEANREGRSFTPKAETNARKRSEAIGAHNRSVAGKQPNYYDKRWGLMTGRWLQRKYGIPDSALDKK